MRHYKKGRKLGTDASHTKAIKKSLIAALLENDRIKTTEPRAKEIRPEVDRVITWAKRGDLHARRLAIAKVGDQELVRELFEKVEQGMFKDRPGGYTRIIKLGARKGDKAPMVIIELVTEPVKSKEAPKPVTKKAAPKKAAKKESAAEAESEAKAEVEEMDAAEEAEASNAAAEEAATAEAAGDASTEAVQKAEGAVDALDASEDAAKAKESADEAAEEKAE